LKHPLKAISNEVFSPLGVGFASLGLRRKRGADQLFFVANEDMLICIRGRWPDHFPAGEGVSRINDVNPAQFLIAVGCETGPDEIALIVCMIWLAR
jgi:hypothetical protein